MNRKQTSNVPQPLPHQRACLAKIGECLRKGITPILFVMASGLGKTYVAAFAYQIFRQMAKRARVLFLAHQVDLLDQAKDTFEKVFRDQLTYGHYEGRIKRIDADAVFATLQSTQAGLFRKRRKGQRKPFGRRDFDCIIVDESHHGQAPTYKGVIQYFQPRCLIGMTATPDRMDLKDIREIFGGEVHTLDLEDALARGLLTPVDYRILADEIVDKGKLKVPPHQVSIQQLNRIFFNRKRDSEIVKIILDRIADVPQPKIIIFAGSIKHAEQFSKLLPGAMTIHSRVPRVERRQRLELFRKGLLRVVVAVDQFNEGVDIPEANVLVFMRSTQSRTIFLQQLGRGLRQVPGKGRVLVLDFVANCERLAMLDELHREIKTRAHQGGGARHEVKVDWGQVTFEERARDILELLRKIQIGLTPEVLLQYLRDFYRQHGRAPTGNELAFRNGMPDKANYHAYFGGLGQAFQLAGIPPEAISRRQKASMEAGSWSKEELVAKLREFYREKGRVPTERDLNPSGGMPSSSTYRGRFKGGLLEAFQLAEIPAEALREWQLLQAQKSKRWSNAQLLEILHEFHRTNGRRARDSDLTGARGLPAADTYRNRFGSLAEAHRQAGIPADRPTAKSKVLACERLLSKLREFYQRHGRAPKAKELIPENGMPHWTRYNKYFPGGLTEAFRLCSFPPEAFSTGQKVQMESVSSREESPATSTTRILAKLKQFYQTHGRSPRRREFTTKLGMPSWATFRKYFPGGLHQACEQAEVPLSDHQLVQLQRMSNEELIGQLKQFYQTYDRVPLAREFTAKYGLSSTGTFRQRFGSLKKALSQAGILSARKQRHLDPDHLIAKLKSFYEVHGRAPGSADLTPAQGMPNHGSYRKHFTGGFPEALAAAGLPPEAFSAVRRGQLLEPGKLKEWLLGRLREFYARHDRVPTRKELGPAHDMPSRNTLNKHFGSIGKALLLAGVPIAKLSSRQRTRLDTLSAHAKKSRKR